MSGCGSREECSRTLPQPVFRLATAGLRAANGSVLCHELNHMKSWVATKNSVHLIAHTKWEYEHGKPLPNWNHSSVTNHQLYEHSQPLITPRSRVHRGKLTSYLQIYPVHASQLHFFKTHFNNIIPFMTRSFKWFFPSGLSTKSCMHLSFLPCVPYAQPISIFIWLLKYEDWFNSGSDFFLWGKDRT